MSATNFGLISGHLVRAPKIFPNQDGSKKVLFTVANNYGYGDNAGTNYIEVEGFVSKDVKGPGLAGKLPTGSHVSMKYELRSSTYEKNGETHYVQKAVIADFFRDIEILDTKARTDELRAKEAAKANEAQAQADAQAAAAGQFAQPQAQPAQGQFVQAQPGQFVQAQPGYVAGYPAQGAPMVAPGYGYGAQGQFVPGNFAG